MNVPVRLARTCLVVLPALIALWAATTSAVADVPLRDLIERFATDQRALERFYAIETSATTGERLSAFLTEWESRLDAIPYDSLPVAERIDYLLLTREIRDTRRRLTKRRDERPEWIVLAPFLEPLIALEEARWRGESPQPSAAAKTLAAAVEALRDHRRALEERIARAKEERKSPEAGERDDAAAEPALPGAEAVEEVARAIDDVRRALGTWYENQEGYIPTFAWWVKNPYEALRGELEKYRDFLRKELGRPRDEDELRGNPIGRDELEAALAYELIAYSPEALITLAEREFEWCRRERDRAATELDFPGDPRAALEHVKGLHVAPGEQAELVYEQAREAIRFLDERGL